MDEDTTISKLLAQRTHDKLKKHGSQLKIFGANNFYEQHEARVTVPIFRDAAEFCIMFREKKEDKENKEYDQESGMDISIRYGQYDTFFNEKINFILAKPTFDPEKIVNELESMYTEASDFYFKMRKRVRNIKKHGGE